MAFYITCVVLINVALTRWVGNPILLFPVLKYNLILFTPLFLAGGIAISEYDRVGRENLIIKEEFRIAKTQFLQSQLSPHVLFNALNSLAELITQDSQAAEKSVNHMAHLLRKVLRLSHLSLHALADERELLEDYLEMELLRFGDRLDIRWEWDFRLDQCQVPPLVLHPLVENALKHGIRSMEAGGIVVIHAREVETVVSLGVRNNGAPLDPGFEMGVGLGNLQQRLGTCFGGLASLSLTQEGEWVNAEVRVPRDQLGVKVNYLGTAGVADPA